MLQVIIIDDEPLIRNGLQKMFIWENYNMEIQAVFPNGILAFEYIKMHPVDLVITDIKMPIMSGIEFMTECQKNNIKTKYIILSGFSDFEYVKSAAKIGIENYLLKPIDTQEMSRTLLQVQNKIEAERKNKIFVDEGIGIFKNNLLFRLITGTISYNELEERKDYVDLPLINSNYQVTAIKFSFSNTDNIVSHKKPPLASILHHLTCYKDIFPVTDYSGRFLYLLFCNYNGERERMNVCFKDLIQYVSITSDFRISIAVGQLVHTIDEIVDSYKTASLLINTATSYELNDIRWEEDSEGNDAFMLPHIELYQLIQLNEKCLYQNEEHIQEIITDILYNNRYIPLEGLQMLAVTIISKVYSNYIASETDTCIDYNDTYSRINEITIYTDYNSILTWTQNMIHSIFSLRNTKDSSLLSPSHTKTILAYLESHYYEDINLKTIADHFNVNALYLGRKIKSETGYSFTDYLNRLRLKNAENLLLNTKLSAKQIAHKVGYNNDQYFNIQFKKYLNMTPGEFRKKHNQLQ